MELTPTYTEHKHKYLYLKTKLAHSTRLHKNEIAKEIFLKKLLDPRTFQIFWRTITLARGVEVMWFIVFLLKDKKSEAQGSKYFAPDQEKFSVWARTLVSQFLFGAFQEQCKATLDLDSTLGKQMKGCVDGKLVQERQWTEAYQKIRKSK